LLAAALTATPATATTFVVTNTADSGDGSLRAALTAAQSCAGGPHAISFDIPVEALTGGVAVITLASELPALNCPGTTLDGTTQTANRGNTNDVTLGTGGTVGTGVDGRPGTGDEPGLPQRNGPEVEIVGTNVSTGILDVAASGVTIRGLSLHGGGDFSGVGTGSGTIHVQSGNGILIEQNVIGASATSYTLPMGAQTQDNVILVTGGSGITIEENLLGFARWRTILVLSPTVGDLTIRDNEIKGSFDGIDFGNVGLGPSGIVNVTENFIHDTVDNGSGSTEFAFFITQSGMTGTTAVTNNTVTNVDVGASIDASRPVLFQHNVVSAGVNDAVTLSGGLQGLAITQNAFADNLLAIDLGNDGITPNDGTKLAALPNDGMDYPVLTAATLPGGGMLSVTGYVGSDPNGNIVFANTAIEIYKADNNPSNQRGPIVFGDGESVPHGEGAIYLGTITSDASGLWSASIAIPPGVSLLPGDPITALGSDGGGNTSEFGPNAHLPGVLDVDADGVTAALTDGLLVLRAFFGLTGGALTSNAVGAGCMRCTPAAISDHIATLDRLLDVDDTDSLAALADGLMILRYLFGLTGAGITNAAVGGGCGRCDAAAVEPYLQSIDYD
jgi:hypothetical protein